MEMVDGQPAGMTFMVRIGDHVTTYRMPVRREPIYKQMMADAPKRGTWQQQNDRPAKLQQQAKRTAWRLALDWLKIQCAYVQNGIRHPAEVFLADMVIIHEGVETTVGQLCIARGGQVLGQVKP